MTVIPLKPQARTVVGIDLGTTNSLVALLQDGRPVVIPNRLGELLTPSAVSIDDGTVLVGAPALARAGLHPQETALSFKRDMGTDRHYQLRGRTFTPVELSALVLRTLKEDAEAFLGRPIDEAVITVPAYFDELQRAATRDAALVAGLVVERIINEPTAAALAYGLHHRQRAFRAAVLDLGGGTFDVTVLEVLEGVIEIQATAGDTRLGGDDFAAALVELILARHPRGASLRENEVALARLRVACEAAKRRLSSEEQTHVVITGLTTRGLAPFDLQELITRADAERAWAGLLARLRAPVLRALRDAGAQPTDISEVLLVGGATRTPVVYQLAAELFGRLPIRELPPDEAVGMGAAVQAALKARDAAVDDLVVTDVTAFSMGIAVASSFAHTHVHGLFEPIIERGTVIPVSRVKSFHTLADGQPRIEIEVFQGEHSLCRDNRKLGQLTVKGLPHKPAGDVSIDVRFTYDLNGLLEVEVTVPSTGQTMSGVFQHTPGRLDAAAIERARKGMEKLKFHPRDALPNVTALARAEALHVELTGEPREYLALAMTALRAALERQEPAVIEPAREQLVAVTAALAGRAGPRAP
jgi:molecular chaperone HscC